MNTEIIEYIKKSKTITQHISKKPFYEELKQYCHDAGYDNIIEYCYFLKTGNNGECQYNGCTKKTTFISFKKGYNSGCCRDHSARVNNLKKYGVENVMQNEDHKKKFKESMIKKYGVAHALQNKDLRKKATKSLIDGGGVGASNVKTKEKMKATNIKKYGVANTGGIPSFIEKRQNTMEEKYGFRHALQNPQSQKKRRKTCNERFGADHHMQSDEFVKKMKFDFIQNKLDKILFRVKPLFDPTDYSHVSNSMRWECVTCGHQFEDHLNNGQIPRCLECFPLINKGFSKVEQELVEILQSDFELETNDRKILNGKELDILIPSENVAIEFNGIYWHSELFGKNKKYHLDKTVKCSEKGIQLIHVFETEWMEQQEIILSIIRSKLGKFEKRIFARKCTIETISRKEKKIFLEENHLQGNDKSSKLLGLYFDGELVSVMTFGKPRFNKNYEYELVRFANKMGYQVIGGASKLLKHFIKFYNPKSIITYADKRFSDGTFYEKIGFEKLKDSQPSYWYFKGTSGLSNRTNWQKKMLETKLDDFNPDLTEWENMQLNGFNRIWDCGNYVFGMQIS